MSARVKESLALAGRLERLWADERFKDRATNLREFITSYWIAYYQLGRGGQEAFEMSLQRVTGSHDPNGNYHWRRLLREDAPRFDGMLGNRLWRCPAVKTRGTHAGEPCGRSPRESFRVTDPATGEWTLRGWCSAHQAESQIMWARERSLTNTPEPMPNAGGLLPSYMSATNWPDLYVSVRPEWKPPYVGIIADDWPLLARVTSPPLTKVSLRAIDGGRETEVGAVPSLRLVTS